MKKLITFQIDSFTKEKFKGNPAGVVINADGLTDEQMLLIARELNNRETAFLFNKKGKDFDGTIRYFTPIKEVPLCGHATIAAMYAKALYEKLNSCVLRIKTKVGILPFEIIRKNNDYEIGMTQGKVEISDTLNKIVTLQLLKAIGISLGEINANCPIQISSTGNPLIMLCINKRDRLNNLNVNLDKLKSLCLDLKCNGCFVFTFDSDKPEILTFARMFAPIISTIEDSVTGTAHGALGAFLVKNKLIKINDNFVEFKGMQGEVLNRPGIVTIHIDLKNQSQIVSKIKGDATLVFKTEIEL